MRIASGRIAARHTLSKQQSQKTALPTQKSSLEQQVSVHPSLACPMTSAYKGPHMQTDTHIIVTGACCQSGLHAAATAGAYDTHVCVWRMSP